MHFAETEGRFVVCKEFDFIVTPFTGSVRASQVLSCDFLQVTRY